MLMAGGTYAHGWWPLLPRGPLAYAGLASLAPCYLRAAVWVIFLAFSASCAPLPPPPSVDQCLLLSASFHVLASLVFILTYPFTLLLPSAAVQHATLISAPLPPLFFLLFLPFPSPLDTPLHPATPLQVTLLSNTLADKRLDDLPHYRALLQQFQTKEVRPGLLLLPEVGLGGEGERRLWWGALSSNHFQTRPRR